MLAAIRDGAATDVNSADGSGALSQEIMTTVTCSAADIEHVPVAHQRGGKRIDGKMGIESPSGRIGRNPFATLRNILRGGALLWCQDSLYSTGLRSSGLYACGGSASKRRP